MSAHDSSTDNSGESQTTGARKAQQEASARLGHWVRNKWRLDQLLGVGGMAAVYAATHRNGSRAALKILHPEFSREKGVRERFLREGYVANKVDHPGRVAILDDDETEAGEAYLVMELLQGQTLQEMWKRGTRKVAPRKALQIAEAVLDTLDSFHGVNIVHRDLKPANIFLTDDGQTKLLDFGVAKVREQGAEMTRAGTALGTPSYMSPEQAMGKTDSLDGRSDLYAVGATLYAVISGERLHRGKSDNEAFILAATQPAPSLARVAPEAPVGVIAFVDKALQWDRRKRFQSAAEMRDACRQLIAELDSDDGRAAAAPEPTGREWAPGRSGRTLAAGYPLAEVAAPARARRTHEPPGRAARRGQASAPPAETVDAQQRRAIEELFGQLEHLVRAAQQHGRLHAQTAGRAHRVHQAVIEALRVHPTGIDWAVRPYCLTYRDTTKWAPEPPAEAVPFHLYRSGMRGIRITAGVTEQEIDTLCRTLLRALDDDREQSDLAGVLWEAQLKHVECLLREEPYPTSAAEQQQLVAERQQLEAHAREELAPAAATATGKGSQGAQPDPVIQALQIEPAVKATMQTQLTTDAQQWRERFLDVVPDAFADAARRGDVQLVLGPCAAYAWQLAQSHSYEELFKTHAKLLERLSQSSTAGGASASATMLTSGMFTPKLLRELFIASTDGEQKDHAERRRVVLEGLRNVVQRLDAKFLSTALMLGNEIADAEALKLLESYMQRAMVGHEKTVVGQLERLGPDLARRVVALLGSKHSQQTTALLRPLLQHPNPVLRCEAMAQLASSPDHLGQQLLKVVEGADQNARQAALETLVRYQVRSAGPGLMRVVEDEGFAARPLAEQRQLLETLYSLHSARAEGLLVAIVDKRGIKASADDQTRALAARILGERATSAEAFEAVSNAARRRLFGNAELRDEAARAAAAIANRMNSRAASADEVKS